MQWLGSLSRGAGVPSCQCPSRPSCTHAVTALRRSRGVHCLIEGRCRRGPEAIRKWQWDVFPAEQGTFVAHKRRRALFPLLRPGRMGREVETGRDGQVHETGAGARSSRERGVEQAAVRRGSHFPRWSLASCSRRMVFRGRRSCFLYARGIRQCLETRLHVTDWGRRRVEP